MPTGAIEGGNMDPVIASELGRRLAGVDDLSRRYEMASHRLTKPQGRAGADYAYPDGRFVGIYAGHALSTALDHLGAWRALVDAGCVPIQAHMTLLRVALEGSVRCRWLVDAKLAPGVRVGRGFAARRDDQDERRKFEASREALTRPRPRTSGMSAVQRLDLLDDPAAVKGREAAGIPSIGFADTTSLMVKYRHERLFRLLSAAAHPGKEWGHAASQLVPGGGASPPGVGHGTFSAKDDVVLGLTVQTIAAVERAVVAFEIYSSAPANRP
jgi:hypothetical protein